MMSCVLTFFLALPFHNTTQKYRYDVQYHADKRQFMPSQHVELTDKPNPLHARDPTAPSTLKNPVKPQLWKREFKRPNKPQYRYVLCRCAAVLCDL
jgi:hypothetical protein